MANTIAGLLDSAIRHFPMLLHGMGEGEEAILRSLCIDAIREYQDRAGFVASLDITADQNTLNCGVALPVDWLEKISATDSCHVLVSTCIYDNETEPGVVVKYIKAVPDSYSVAPYVVTYFRDIAGMLSASIPDEGPDPFDTVSIPAEAVGIISRYLKALIEIPNSSRLAEVYRGMDHPAAEQITPSDTLLERKTAIELEMDEQQDFLPPVMVL